MDFDRERELEDAGIDAFEFSLMDEDERRQVLDVNFLDPDDYDMIDLEPEFHAWENLQRAGLRLDELSYMDDAEKRSALEDAGLDPDDYDVDSSYYHYSYVSSSKHAAKEEQPKKETPKFMEADMDGMITYSYQDIGSNCHIMNDGENGDTIACIFMLYDGPGNGYGGFCQKRSGKRASFPSKRGEIRHQDFGTR